MLINDLPLVMLMCLVITILVEVLMSLVLGLRNKDILNVVLVNVVTNPIVTSVPVLILLLYGIKARLIVFIILEILTLFIEGLIYLKTLNYKSINPFIISLILNGLSLVVGELVNYFMF